MLKKITILIFIVICLMGIVTGCGTKGPPTPPEPGESKKINNPINWEV